MGAIASLADTAAVLSVQPGAEAKCVITVRNSGSVVDRFTFQPLGLAADWITVEPPELRLLPGDSGTATVHFRPPKLSSVTPGETPWAVWVRSDEDPDGSVVEEGSITVGVFRDISAELLPRSGRARGKRRVRQELAVDNRGNDVARVDAAGVDLDERLLFNIKPAVVEVPPGTAGFARVRVKSRRRFWRGHTKSHTYQVVVRDPEDASARPVVLDGTLMQDPVLPRWLFKVLALLVAAAIALAAIWFLLLRPVIKDTAKTAALKSTAQTRQAAQQAAQQAAAQNAAVQQQQAALSKLAKKAGVNLSAQKKNQATSTLLPEGNPFILRLQTGPRVQSQTAAIPKGQTFLLTDMVLENPAGDQGRLNILRGTQVLFSTNLSNFRDLDYHFVAPVLFGTKQPLVLQVSCQNPAGAPACTPSASVDGFLQAAH